LISRPPSPSVLGTPGVREPKLGRKLLGAWQEGRTRELQQGPWVPKDLFPGEGTLGGGPTPHILTPRRLALGVDDLIKRESRRLEENHPPLPSQSIALGLGLASALGDTDVLRITLLLPEGELPHADQAKTALNQRVDAFVGQNRRRLGTPPVEVNDPSGPHVEHRDEDRVSEFAVSA